MKSKQVWHLILNNGHTMMDFWSKAALKQWATEKRLKIKRSYTDTHTYFTEAVEYVPGRQ